MPSSHLILCHPLLLLPSIFPNIIVFSSESVLRIRWPKYWSFSFNIGPSNECSGLISFRIDWFDILAVQGTIKSLLQYLCSKTSVLWCSAFFIVYLSHLYRTTAKTIALTIWTFVGKIMSLLFNTPSRCFAAFLPRSSCLLISWLQSPSTVILEPKKTNSVTVSLVYPSLCHEVMGQDAMVFVLWMLSLSQLFHCISYIYLTKYLAHYILYIFIYKNIWLYMYNIYVRARSLQLYSDPLWAPCTVAQAPLSMGFSRWDYWGGLPCPPPGNLPNPGMKPELFMSPVLAGWFFTTSATWEAMYIYNVKYIMCQVFCKQNLI